MLTFGMEHHCSMPKVTVSRRNWRRTRQISYLVKRRCFSFPSIADAWHGPHGWRKSIAWWQCKNRHRRSVHFSMDSRNVISVDPHNVEQWRVEERSCKGRDGGVLGEWMFPFPPARGPGERYSKLSMWSPGRSPVTNLFRTFYRLTEPLLVPILLILYFFP